MARRRSVAPGCFFEPADDDIPVNPVIGKKRSSIHFDESPYHRKSVLEDIPDDFITRMYNYTEVVSKEKSDIKNPSGFTVTVAYNKGGYQVVPEGDLDDI